MGAQAHNLTAYAALGFPGCIGSIDATHIGWDRAPASQKYLFIGKEGYTSLGYQAIVNRDGFIMSWTTSFIGCANDQIISQYDETIRRLRVDSFYTDYTYDLFDVHAL